MSDCCICKKRETLYVVYPNDLKSYEFEAAETLADRLSDMTGIRPVLMHGGGVPEGAPALLIGKTDCEESRQAMSDLSYGEGLLRILGNRVVFACHNGDVLPLLIPVFLRALDAIEPQTGLVLL